MSKFSSNKVWHNNLYLLLTAVMFIFTALLNVSNILTFCSFIYVLVVLTANLVSEIYGKKKTIQAVILCVVINVVLLWNSKYYINNIDISIILFGSLLSVLLSTYCGVNVFLKLKPAYNLHIRSFISLILCSVIDCTIMAGFLLSKFPAYNVLFIFVQDIMFKFLYSLAISFCLLLVFYFLQQFKNLRKTEF